MDKIAITPTELMAITIALAGFLRQLMLDLGGMTEAERAIWVKDQETLRDEHMKWLIETGSEE